jgi:putative hydrolase of the HAD superfamily
MSKLFIFDFFGVLSGEIANRFFLNHYNPDIALKIKDKYFKPADVGNITFIETLKKISLDIGINYEAILEEFKNYGVINEELFKYILKLKKNTNNHIALLSNAPKDLHKLLYSQINLNEYFERVYISGQQGLFKPDLKFYELLVNSFNQKFDEIFMIDDSEKNLKNLDKLNIKGILYTNNEKLFEQLNAYL